MPHFVLDSDPNYVRKWYCCRASAIEGNCAVVVRTGEWQNTEIEKAVFSIAWYTRFSLPTFTGTWIGQPDFTNQCHQRSCS